MQRFAITLATPIYNSLHIIELTERKLMVK